MKLSTSLNAVTAALFLVTSLHAAAGDLSVSKQIVINASPSTTWKMIGDFNHLDVWHPVVVNSEITAGGGDAVGSVRKLTLGNGANITEKLLSHSDSKNSYSYAITESPLPVDGYVSVIEVSEAEDGKSVVKWSSSFDAKNATDKEATDTIAGVYDAGLNSIKKHFE